MATPSVNPINVASFRSDIFNYDSLLAGECLSKSAKIGASQGILKRGTVLGGVAAGVPPTGVTPFVYGNAPAGAILAADIDTGTGAAVTGLVYTQGKFLDTAMIFSANGAATDVAQLWNVGIYVLTVEQRSGQLVPLMNLPTSGAGPLPQAMSAKDAAEATKEEVEAIRAAQGQSPVAIPGPASAKDPAWYTAAFGERELTKEEQAREKTVEQVADLDEKQQKAREELTAKQNKEASELAKKQRDERAQLAKQEAAAMQHGRQANPPVPTTAPKK
ncbi:MAG TPA: hypothetical protein VE030_11230 [Burkholderiales bacterium]|nr:hypothetical protein [Burkholderiales bacterium]